MIAWFEFENIFYNLQNKIKKEETRKRALSVEQLRLLRDYPCEEFEKKYPVSYSIVVPGIPDGHVAKVVSVRPC